MIRTTLGAVLRSHQAYCLQLSQAEALDWGMAYTSTRFAGLHEANQLREFAVPAEEDAPVAYAAVEAYFAERGLTCSRWTLAAGQPYETVGPLLWERGYRRREVLACALRGWPRVAVQDDLRILPARPMRQQYRRTFLEPDGPYSADYRELSAEAGLERLDSAGYEARIALLSGDPVGRGALFQVGDIGRICDLYVHPEHRRQGVATALLAHLLTIAKQYMTRTVCLEVEADNTPGLRCAQRMGFVPDGRSIEFHRPNVLLPEYAPA